MKTKKTQKESEEMLNRKLGNPFMVKISSGDHEKHCDRYQHGSIHTIREDKDGIRWVDGIIDDIPLEFDIEIINEKPEVKVCPNCKSEFEVNWPFIINKGEQTCIRCYESKNHFHRENVRYRDALRAELKLEMGISDVSASYSEYKKALETIDNYFKNRQEPNKIGAFTDGLKNEIYFALRLGIKQLQEEYGFSNTKKNVGGFPLAFTEMLAECVVNALEGKYKDSNGKVSTMDAYFKERRRFL